MPLLCRADHLPPQRLGVEPRFIARIRSRWVHEDFRIVQCVRDLGTTVPARREPGDPRLDDGVATVAVLEVAVLVVAGGHREMGLARAGQQRAVWRDADRGVEAQRVRVGGALVQRRVDGNTGLGREPRGEVVGRAAGERFRRGARRAGPVRRDGEVRRQRELLEAHEPSSLTGSHAHAFGERGAVLGRVGVPAVLDETDAPGRPGRRLDSRGRVRNRVHRANERQRLAHASRSRPCGPGRSDPAPLVSRL